MYFYNYNIYYYCTSSTTSTTCTCSRRFWIWACVREQLGNTVTKVLVLFFLKNKEYFFSFSHLVNQHVHKLIAPIAPIMQMATQQARGIEITMIHAKILPNRWISASGQIGALKNWKKRSNIEKLKNWNLSFGQSTCSQNHCRSIKNLPRQLRRSPNLLKKDVISKNWNLSLGQSTCSPLSIVVG